MIEGLPARVAGSVNWNWLGGAFLLFALERSLFVILSGKKRFITLWRVRDEGTPLDPEKLELTDRLAPIVRVTSKHSRSSRVAPATSISELSISFLRKCKEHCCVLASFFGNNGWFRGKGMLRSRCKYSYARQVYGLWSV